MSDDFTISLDFSDTERLKDWEPIPEGDYVLTIEDVTREKAKSADKADNIKIVFGVEEPQNRKLFKYFNLGEKSMPFLQKFLEELLGTEVEGSISLSPSDLIGKRIGATLVVKPRNDDSTKYQNEVVGSSWTHMAF